MDFVSSHGAPHCRCQPSSSVRHCAARCCYQPLPLHVRLHVRVAACVVTTELFEDTIYAISITSKQCEPSKLLRTTLLKRNPVPTTAHDWAGCNPRCCADTHQRHPNEATSDSNMQLRSTGRDATRAAVPTLTIGTQVKLPVIQTCNCARLGGMQPLSVVHLLR